MEKIRKLKNFFNKFKIDAYIVPKNDEFFNEYVQEKKDNLRFLTDFTGSFGFALILKNENYLFVDGRYTVQAKFQSGKIFKIITIPNKFPQDILRDKKLRIGYDPKLHTEISLHRLFNKTSCKMIPLKQNLVDNIWKRKLNIKSNKFYNLDNKVTGQASESKINALANLLKKKKINTQFITAPENVAWLLNIRGNDSKFSPIPNCYATINRKKNVNLFCNLKKIDKKTKKYLRNVKIIDINNIEKYLSKIKNQKIQIDSATCSIFFISIIKKNNKLLKNYDSIYYLKSIKNKVEIRNTIESHILDGAALTKFLFWVKNNYKRKKISELSAEKKLLDFRKTSKKFKYLSFPTISGSGPNGAIVHYKANKKTNRLLKKGDLYLIDSGGQYNFGTTDVTRTISLDNHKNRIKNIFTRVLKGHIAVAKYKIKKNTVGSEIDFVARKFLKQINLDYSHGTGHGVGYFLNVHEGPNAITKKNNIKFNEGVIISNEPGYYEEGKFGIRIENLIRVKKNNGLKFENLTMAPIDKTLIEKKLLNTGEIKWLNSYHGKVFANLKKFMNKYELSELKKSCSNL